jgi:hypothetical protein
MPETVALDDIRTDGGTQPREYLNELVLSEYAESMTDGTVFPPVIIFFDGSHYWLADGFHRFFAAKKCGARDISAEVRQGTRREARLYAVGANATHGLRRTNADKRRAAITLLQDKEWQRWSNREIARQCSVTHTFVAKLRRELLDTPSPNAAETMTARTESASITVSDRSSTTDPPDMEFTNASDSFSHGSASPQYDDAFDRLAPSEPISTVDRLALEPTALIHTSPAEEPFAEVPTGVETKPPSIPRTPAAGAPPERQAKLTIEAMASTSQQAPAEWVTDMIVYWLLDLAAQYEGMTSELVCQVAEKLGAQYEQACRELAPPS